MNSRRYGHACEARGFLGSDGNEKGVSCSRGAKRLLLGIREPKPNWGGAFAPPPGSLGLGQIAQPRMKSFTSDFWRQRQAVQVSARFALTGKMETKDVEKPVVVVKPKPVLRKLADEQHNNRRIDSTQN